MLELESVGRRKPNGDPNDWLVQGISISVQPSERLAITGPSGAGKTVLLRLIALLDEPDAGEIRWHGATTHDAQVPGYRRQVIYLHQRPFFAEGTARENLALPFQFATNQSKQFSEARLIEMLARIGRPADLLGRNVQALSGGETQLLALLRALQLEPTMLLIDEPTSAADAKLAEDIEHLIVEWCTEGRSLLLVSHNPDQVARLATRVYEIDRGRPA